VLELADRVLMLEAGFRAPLSHLDRLAAERLDRKRHEPHEEAMRRLAAFREAERAGKIDEFVRKLKAGEACDADEDDETNEA
jgi:hypothetical protein